MSPYTLVFFFFNDTATTEIYTLSLHDALPISREDPRRAAGSAEDHDGRHPARGREGRDAARPRDRKSTRLNSSHGYISYAVFCLKKKNKKSQIHECTAGSQLICAQMRYARLYP